MAEYIEILMADDDEEDCMIVRQSFKEMYPADRINFAEDGIELLSLLQTHLNTQKLPSLILLDLNMPRLNGVETLREIKNVPEYGHIPVVILSTSVNEIQKEECISLGAAHYLTKPATYNEATEVVRLIHGYASRS